MQIILDASLRRTILPTNGFFLSRESLVDQISLTFLVYTLVVDSNFSLGQLYGFLSDVIFWMGVTSRDVSSTSCSFPTWCNKSRFVLRR